MENLITQVSRTDGFITAASGKDGQAVPQPQQLQSTWTDSSMSQRSSETETVRLERLSLSTNGNGQPATNVTVSDAVNPITSVNISVNNNNDSNNITLPPATTASFPAPNATSGGNGVLVRKPRPARRFFKSLLCCWRISPRGNRAHGGTGGTAGTVRSGEEDLGRNGCEYYPPQLPEKLLLPSMRPSDSQKICLIVDLDETLVHSSFKPVKNPDFIIPVEIDGVIHQVYVLKRPFVDEFLQRIGNIYECVLFTASLAKYADPVADLLDKWGVFRSRLFREACVFHKGNYVKDLNRLGRDLKRVVIVDNSPASYSFHPDNAIPVQSWFDDMNDSELLDLVPFLERLAKVDNVYSLLRNCNEPSPPLEM